jgi:predicted alpha/beta-fold hydrolase
MKEGASTLASYEEAKIPLTSYRAPVWLPGGHLQTIYAYCLPRPSSFRFRRERWDTLDGDFIDLDWLDSFGSGATLIVLFHGLEGGSRSHYALSLANELRRQNCRGVIVHSRGCSGEVNRLARSYHAGDSAEIGWVLRRLKHENPKRRLHVVGISMGGNDLLKWLGEQGDRASEIIDRAAAVSAPIDLKIAAQQLDFGWNRRLYTRDFLRTMRRKVLAKIAAHDLRLDARSIRAACTFHEFDNLYTAPVHGFNDAEDYWTKASSKPWLKQITVPTLIINARNDPFFPTEALPRRKEVSDAVTLEYPESGGHVGFVSGNFPGHLGWLPRRLLSFFFEPAP